MKPRRPWQSDSTSGRKLNGRIVWRKWLRGFERLEDRRMLDSVSWTGMGDGVNWTNAKNWSTNAVPGQADDVTISVSGNPTIQLSSGIQFINSLVTSNVVKLTGGTLQIGTTAQIGANLILAGGTILGGTFNESGGGLISLSTFGGKLDGVTVNGIIDAATQSGNATVYDGLTLNGTLSLGNSGGSTSGQIMFGDSTHAAGGLMGTGAVVFGASASNSIGNNSSLGGASGTLTVGQNVTIYGQSGSIVNAFTTGSITNQGAINADTSGGTILLGSSTGSVSNQGSIEVTNGASLNITNFANQFGATVTATASTLTISGSINNLGTMTATNSTVNLTGSFSQADLGTFNRSGGTVNVTGMIQGNVTLDSSTGSWIIASGGSLANGTLTQNDGVTAGFAPTGGILENETINGDFNLTLAANGSLTVLDSLTVTGNLRLGNSTGTTSAEIFLGSGTEVASSYSNTQAGYHISDDTKLIVEGQIIFGTSQSNAIVNNNIHVIPKPGPNDPPAVTTYINAGIVTYFGGSEIEISGAITGSGGSITNEFSRSTIQIDTSATVSGTGSALQLGGSGLVGVVQDALVNDGSLQATSGGSLVVSDLNQTTGSVTVTSAALELTNSLANGGTITATNSSVNLNGTFTQAQLGALNSSGSTVTLSGTLLGGLALNASTGSWILNTGGKVMGGTINESGGAELAFANGTLMNGVVVNGPMDLAGTVSGTTSNVVHVDGGLTVNGTIFLGNGLGTSNGIIQFGDLFDSPGTLGGNATVVMGGSNSFASGLTNGWNGSGTQTLTIGPNVSIHGKFGGLFQTNGTTGDAIVIQGSVSADVAGGTIQLGSSGPVINDGTIQAINGGTIAGIGLINSTGQTITVNASTLSLSSTWSNQGTIVSTNSTLNLAGNFTRATLGNFVRTAGTVNVMGTLSGGLNLDAANGSWTLDGGTVNGGTVNTSGGSQLILSNFGGTIAGVTINGNVDAIQQSAQARFTGGLVLNGTITMGVGTNSATLRFGQQNVAAGSLTGDGTIVFVASQPGGNLIENNSGLTGASGTLTIGPNIKIEGNTGGLSGAIINEGTIIADVAGGIISINSGGGTFSNQGTMQANSGTFDTTGAFSIDGSGTLSTNWTAALSVGGNLVGNSTAFASSNPQGVITLNGGFSLVNPQLIEVMSQDLGNTAAGFKNNFVYGTIDVAADVKLVDQSANAPGGPNALYVNSLVVNTFSTLNLNGLHVYARAMQINGSVINGTITQFPDGGPININSPLPGNISPAGDQDTWTFFGRAGESVGVYVNPGLGNAPAPVFPNLSFANAQLLAPGGAVLATGNSTSSGASVALPNVTLPADGVYSIIVSAAAGHSSATGNYDLAVFDVTPQIQPILLGQTVTGNIRTPVDLQQWTFTALANEQVKFHLASENSGGFVYSLTGPNGFVGFSNASTDSGLITLPANGTYTLAVQGVNGATGSYAFAVDETSQNVLPLNGSVNGTLAGSGQAELYTIAVPAVQALQVALSDSSNIDSNELYLRFGSPPTRETYDYRYPNANSADQSILVQKAAIGTWYVLVYTDNVPSQSTFTLSATGYPLRLSGSLPTADGNSEPETLNISGAGFQAGAVATLVGPGNAQIAATTTSVDSYTQLVATFPAGLLPGVYSVEVTQGAASDTISNALTISAGGAAHLETSLQVPSALGRHVPSTLFVSYANDGTVAMPAPLLVLSSTDPVQVPLMTLDASKVSSRLDRTRVPDGYSTTLLILANGAVPGILEPGESVTVPVYWGGLEQPWTLFDMSIPLSLGVVDTSSTDPIDWTSLKSSIEPPDIPSGAWDSVFNTLVSQLGSTSGQFVAALDSNAAYLGSLGVNVKDVAKLFGFMIDQADAALGPFQTLATAMDASLPLPGAESLSFDRDYRQAIGSRYTAGILGLGWSTSWQMALSKNSDGTIDVGFGNGQLTATFQPDSLGGYVSPLQDYMLTANADGTYTLTQKDGSFSVFSSSGALAYEQDTNGNRLTLSYNAAQQIVGIAASSGQSLTLAYNAAGRLSSLIDSAGRVTTYSYDPSNQFLLSVTGPSGTTSYTYDPTTNGLTSTTYPDATHTFYTYDGQGRVASTSADGGAGAIAFTYNGPGEVTATDAVGDATQSFYDVDGFLAKTVDGLGNPLCNTYDAQGNLLTQTDAAGNTTTYTYDSSGNLESVTDPLHALTQFTYGPLSRLASFTDPNGNVTNYTHDGNGNLTSVTYADGSGTINTFDPLGDPISYVNRNGQTTSLTYNSSGQVTKETFADGSQYDYSYDGHNNLLTATDATGTTTFTYDAADRMTSVSYPSGQSLTFTYDAGGRRIRMVDQSGYTVNYSYTPAGDLSQLTDGSNQPIVTYQYDAARRLQEQDNANGTFTTYGYDADGNLLHVVNHAPGGAINSEFDATYNLLNQMISATTPDGSWTYSYDADGQLVHAVFTSTNPSLPNQDLAYNYDRAGNRTNTVINGVTTTYVTNSLNEYTTIGGILQQYDADGNRVFDGTNTYTYNQLDELTGVSNVQGATQYVYNALGQRVSTISGGQTTQYLNDPMGLGNVVSTYNGTGGLVAHFNYGLSLVSQLTTSGSTYFYDFDTTGSTAGLTNAGGSYADSYRYLPFGESQSTSGAVANPFQFVGALGVQTGADGLSFMRARFYNAAIGRFTSSDPLQLGGGDANFYRYAANQPLQFVDPSGLEHGTRGLDPWDPPPPPPVDAVTQDEFIQPWERPYNSWLLQYSIWWQELYGTGEHLSRANEEVERWSILTEFAGENMERELGDYKKFASENYFIYIQKLQNAIETRNSALRVLLHLITQDTVFEVISQFPTAFDPNDKIGPGYGSQGFVAADAALPYRIDFENDPSATAPAQDVVITDQLSSNLDWTSVRITEVGWGDTMIAVPPNSQHYQTTVPMTFNGKTFDVDVQVGINLATGLITAEFSSIDPTTQLPPDVLTGFLPPEDGTGRGMGHISYTVLPLAGLPTGTQIRNVANVSFDEEQIVATDQVNDEDPTQGVDPNKQALVTIDAGAPTSSVAALSAKTPSTNFTVNWSGTDDSGGSGIASYDVFVSDNGGAYTLFVSSTAQTSATFSGQNGHTYRFYSVATDNVGHVEPAPPAPDATTTVMLISGDVTLDGHVNVADVSGLMTALSDVTKYASSNNLAPADVVGVADLSGDGKVNNLDLQALIDDLANGGGSAAQIAGSGSSSLAGESGNPSSQPALSSGVPTTLIVSAAEQLAKAVVSEDVTGVQPIVASSGAVVRLATSAAVALNPIDPFNTQQPLQAEVAAGLPESITIGAVFGEGDAQHRAGTIAAHDRSRVAPTMPALIPTAIVDDFYASLAFEKRPDLGEDRMIDLANQYSSNDLLDGLLGNVQMPGSY
jgi:RHS repeat-associated protein